MQDRGHTEAKTNLFSCLILAVDEQNAQTSASTSSLAEAFVTVAVTAAGQVVTTSTARTERGLEPIQGKAFFSYTGAFKACNGSFKFVYLEKETLNYF